LLKCFFILLVSSTSPFFPLNSLIFSFALLPHFSLPFYSLLSFFLSSFLPYYSLTYSCCHWSSSLWRLRIIRSALMSNYFLLTILCGTFPWYWLIRLPFCFCLLKSATFIIQLPWESKC
jgi:hypothetical protein